MYILQNLVDRGLALGVGLWVMKGGETLHNGA
jgi:hypothetical protein